MIRYRIANIKQPPLIGQPSIPPQSPAKNVFFMKPYIDVGLITLGVIMSTVGYYKRKSDFGSLAMGAGSSIVGAGIVLLVLDFSGFSSSGSA